MIYTFSLTPPRHAFSTRKRARAADVWRLFQEAAVHGSAAVGWTPDRMARTGVSFVVRAMTVVHHREIVFGEEVGGKTWVSTFRRRILTNREIRLLDPDPIASATQEWVHLRDGVVQRADIAVLESFSPVAGEPSVGLPEIVEPIAGRSHQLRLPIWHTTMDPIGHANHPAYVDWVEEAIATLVHAAGLDPVELVPVAERVKYRGGVVAPEEVTVQTRLVGRTATGAVVCEHEIRASDEQIAATATTVRTLAGGEPEALVRILA